MAPRPLPPAVAAATGGDPALVRRHVLDAARQVMDERGLAGTSTRAVAARAGLSAGTIYNYFPNQTRLLAAAIVHRAAGLAGPARDLPERAGRHTVTANLAYFADQAAAVLDQLVPALAAAFSDPELLHAVREELARVPLFDDPAATLQQYLAAEAGLGRVSGTADLPAAAALVVALCHDDAFGRFLTGATGPRRSRRAELALVAAALERGLPLEGVRP